MEGHGSLPAVTVSKLLVRTALPHLSEPVPLEKPDDLARLENG
jgi:hypothetical protein